MFRDQWVSSVDSHSKEIFIHDFDRSHLCGFDLNLTYPQNGHFPSLNPQLPSNLDTKSIRTKKKTLIKQALMIDAQMSKRGLEVDEVRMQKRDEWKREAQRRASGGIDPTYGCDLFDELIDYALQFSFPWGKSIIHICYATQSILILNMKPRGERHLRRIRRKTEKFM